MAQLVSVITLGLTSHFTSHHDTLVVERKGGREGVRGGEGGEREGDETHPKVF